MAWIKGECICVCDGCGRKAERYEPWFRCTECGEDHCPDCIVGEGDEETLTAMCRRCYEYEVVQEW